MYVNVKPVVTIVVSMDLHAVGRGSYELELRTNWIATGSVHFDPVHTTNLTVRIGTQGPIIVT